mmetsp:Transcript_50191/g.155065  ORF Transcript_50191/g.155065 Transcript_50191/m.155065 type:complete len:457 (-) Transcript_50191:2110-3480(-)
MGVRVVRRPLVRGLVRFGLLRHLLIATHVDRVTEHLLGTRTQLALAGGVERATQARRLALGRRDGGRAGLVEEAQELLHADRPVAIEVTHAVDLVDLGARRLVAQRLLEEVEELLLVELAVPVGVDTLELAHQVLHVARVERGEDQQRLRLVRRLHRRVALRRLPVDALLVLAKDVAFHFGETDEVDEVEDEREEHQDHARADDADHGVVVVADVLGDEQLARRAELAVVQVAVRRAVLGRLHDCVAGDEVPRALEHPLDRARTLRVVLDEVDPERLEVLVPVALLVRDLRANGDGEGVAHNEHCQPDVEHGAVDDDELLRAVRHGPEADERHDVEPEGEHRTGDDDDLAKRRRLRVVVPRDPERRDGGDHEQDRGEGHDEPDDAHDPRELRAEDRADDLVGLALVVRVGPDPQAKEKQGDTTLHVQHPLVELADELVDRRRVLVRARGEGDVTLL